MWNPSETTGSSHPVVQQTSEWSPSSFFIRWAASNMVVIYIFVANIFFKLAFDGYLVGMAYFEYLKPDISLESSKRKPAPNKADADASATEDEDY